MHLWNDWNFLSHVNMRNLRQENESEIMFQSWWKLWVREMKDEAGRNCSRANYLCRQKHWCVLELKKLVSFNRVVVLWILITNYLNHIISIFFFFFCYRISNNRSNALFFSAMRRAHPVKREYVAQSWIIRLYSRKHITYAYTTVRHSISSNEIGSALRANLNIILSFPD